ncbi:hypothetical protein F5Y08DRAFT_298928 [Xylaria arbuscula]|nr:hypothetical protein F5Y08DRAFT_298928 [Xylaria arbuscula]
MTLNLAGKWDTLVAFLRPSLGGVSLQPDVAASSISLGVLATAARGVGRYPMLPILLCTSSLNVTGRSPCTTSSARDWE